jgi:hypothetical protein
MYYYYIYILCYNIYLCIYIYQLWDSVPQL